MDPGIWVYDPAKQRAIIPAEHPELHLALQRLWSSEVSRNCQLVALAQGVNQALRMAMGAAVVYVLTNEDFGRWKTSGLVTASPADLRGLTSITQAMEGLRGQHPEDRRR